MWFFLNRAQNVSFSIHTIRKVKFLSKNSNWQNPNIFISFSPKIFLTIFLVKLKLSTAKKSKTKTFSRVFHPKNRQFSREIKVEFLDKKWRFRTVCKCIPHTNFSRFESKFVIFCRFKVVKCASLFLIPLIWAARWRRCWWHGRGSSSQIGRVQRGWCWRTRSSIAWRAFCRMAFVFLQWELNGFSDVIFFLLTWNNVGILRKSSSSTALFGLIRHRGEIYSFSL